MAARFFCDNCGSEVKRDSGRCPKCGRLFAFVRCPQCDYTGKEGEFVKGCPVCGYCTPLQNPLPDKPQKHLSIKAGKLPLWVYIVALLGLLFVMLALFLLVR